MTQNRTPFPLGKGLNLYTSASSLCHPQNALTRFRSMGGKSTPWLCASSVAYNMLVNSLLPWKLESCRAEEVLEPRYVFSASLLCNYYATVESKSTLRVQLWNGNIDNLIRVGVVISELIPMADVIWDSLSISQTYIFLS